MILMIDNYDSFTYNLVQYLRQLGEDVEVLRNDHVSVDVVENLDPEIIVISPGPGTPEKAGASMEIINSFTGKVPILGICLGHQAIAAAFGARIVRALQPVHGKVHQIRHNGSGVFKELKQPLAVTRYHSLTVERETLPDCLEITAWTAEDEIMGLRHREQLVEGVQFHPEAILTEHGMEMLRNFVERAKENKKTGSRG